MVAEVLDCVLAGRHRIVHVELWTAICTIFLSNGNQQAVHAFQ
jgi:hypothetical protein